MVNLGARSLISFQVKIGWPDRRIYMQKPLVSNRRELNRNLEYSHDSSMRRVILSDHVGFATSSIIFIGQSQHENVLWSSKTSKFVDDARFLIGKNTRCKSYETWSLEF